MKENRHFRIIYALLRQGRMTAPELAEELDVSVRTIYRDIDALSGSGIPVYVTTGRNGGIQLLDSFILRKALLSGDEKTTLLTALESLSKMTGGGHHDLLMKLSALFNARAESLMEIDFSRWGTRRRIPLNMSGSGKQPSNGRLCPSCTSAPGARGKQEKYTR